MFERLQAARLKEIISIARDLLDKARHIEGMEPIESGLDYADLNLKLGEAERKLARYPNA